MEHGLPIHGSHLSDVRPRSEEALAAGEHQRPQALVAFQLVDGRRKLADQGAIERIARLGAVQGDHAHALLSCNDDALVGHGASADRDQGQRRTG